MRLQYANRSAKLQNNTRTIKIHTEMPLAHICTRGIPIIYYQRKIYLLLIVLLIISSLSHLVVLSFCLQLPSPKASTLQPTRHSRLALTNLSGSQGTVTLAHSFCSMNLALWFDAKLLKHTWTKKIQNEKPLAHFCTRGIPFIYYQRK